MSLFNLRFRRRKLLTMLGLLAAVAVTPLLQASSAASSVRLDMHQSVRLVLGPGAITPFQSTVAVRDGNTAQFRVIIHNAEAANSGKVAQNLTYTATVPKGPSMNVTVNGQVQADNSISQSPYKTTGANTLTSANGQPFTVAKPRFFNLQLNNIPESQCDQQIYNIGSATPIPDNRVQIVDNGSNWGVTVRPTANGNLDPCFCRLIQLTYVVDIDQQLVASPSPSPSATPTPTPTPSASPSPSPSPSATPTPTPSATPTPTATPTPVTSPSPSPSATPSPGVSPTPTPSITPTPSTTPSPGVTPTVPITVVETPPGPPTEKGAIPRTGAAAAGLLSTLALLISGYLYIRERRALGRATRSSKLK